MADVEDSGLEGKLLAKKLASLIPMSISIDELKLNSRKKKDSEAKNDFEKIYIPPSPVVTTTDNKPAPENPKLSKFSFLLKNKSTPSKSPSFSKMKYELPNMMKIGYAGNNLRPIMTVSFSNLDLADRNKEETKRSTPVPATRIVPEARVVASDGESDDESVSNS